MEGEFNFNAKQLHKDSEYYYNLNMMEKYNNLICLMREQVEKGEYELVLPAQDLTTEVMYWLDDLEFRFYYIPRGYAYPPNNYCWKSFESIDIKNCSFIKIKW